MSIERNTLLRIIVTALTASLIAFVGLTLFSCSGEDPARDGAERLGTQSTSPPVALSAFRFGSRKVLPGNKIPPNLGPRVEANIKARQTIDPSSEARGHLLIRVNRPMTRSLRAELEGDEIRLLDRLGKDAWIGSVTSKGSRALAQREDIVWADVIEPEMKFAGGLDIAAVSEWRRREGGYLVYLVLFHKDVGAGEVMALAARLGATLEEFDANGFPTLRFAKFVMDPARLKDLAAAESVAQIGPSSPPPQPNNEANVQRLSNVDDVHDPPYNLTGANVAVGVWEADEDPTTASIEAAVLNTHDNLAPRVVLEADQLGAGIDFSMHATRVAGTIGAADNPVTNVEGMAPGVTIASWNQPNDLNEMRQAATSPGGGLGILTPIQLSNHSYSQSAGWLFPCVDIGTSTARCQYRNSAYFGRYTVEAAALDSIVAETGLIVFRIAGNERNDNDNVGPAPPATAENEPYLDLIPPATTPPADCNTGGLTTPGGADVDADCLPPRSVAKNVITVGAMDRQTGVILDSSGFGPTDDGRIKPDLIAHGGQVETTMAWRDPLTNTYPTNLSIISEGATSIASPAVAGIAALMLEQADRLGASISPAGMKALLIQTARDFTNDPYARTVGESAEVMEGPDFASGWGVADAQAAADLLRLPAGPGLIEGTLSDSGEENRLRYPIYLAENAPELKVTLGWTDPAGTGLTNPIGAEGALESTLAEGPGTAAGVVDSVLVNNLDLTLISPSGIRYSPWSLEPDHPERPAQRNGGYDDRNNVEQVSVLNPQRGRWIAEVAAREGNLPAAPQEFALAGPLTGLTIVEPTRIRHAIAGTPTEGGRVFVALVASEGLDLPLDNLRVSVGGDLLDPETQVVIHSTIENETWLVIKPGARDAGCYDLEVSLVDPSEIGDVAPRSLCYSIEIPTVDRILAIDRTGSMRRDNKMQSAREAAKVWVDVSNDDDGIGVLSFQLHDENDDNHIDDDELTKLELPLMRAYDPVFPEYEGDKRPYIRDLIIEEISPESGSSRFPNETSLGAALLEAKNLLDEDARNDSEKVIVLVTDGLENYPPYWSTVKPDFADGASDIEIWTVSIGADADDEVLHDIALSTGGLPLNEYLGTGSLSLLSRLSGTLKMIDEENRGEQRFYYREGFPETANPDFGEWAYQGCFNVEPNLDWMTVTLHWSQDGAAKAYLLDPPDTEGNRNEIEALAEAKKHSTYRVYQPRKGEWCYVVDIGYPEAEFFATASAPTRLKARLRIGQTSQVSDSQWATPLRVWIAEDAAVLDAEVKATITRPDKRKISVDLLDDGASEDGQENDGIYGALIEDSLSGPYSVDVVASETSGTGQTFERFMAGSFVIPGAPKDPIQIGEGSWQPPTKLCGGPIWCCWLWLTFIVALIISLVMIWRFWCYLRMEKFREFEYIAFFIILAITLLLGWWLLTYCTIVLCWLLLTVALAVIIAGLIVCFTNLVPCMGWKGTG